MKELIEMKFDKDEIELIKSSLVTLIDEFKKDIIRYAPDFPGLATHLQKSKKEYDDLLDRIIKNENLQHRN